MIGLDINREEYRNDIAEEIMLFFGMEEIVLLSSDDERRGSCDWIMTVRLDRGGTGQYRLHAGDGLTEYDTAFLVESDAPLFIKKQEKRQLKLAAFRLLKQRCPDVDTPWGSLTGIRPTKLFRELTREGGEAYAADMFRDTFSVSDGKTELAQAICRVQKPFIESIRPHDIDVYIGIPFCRTRCLYCSFASEALHNESRLHDYLVALKRDIAAGAALVREGGYQLRALYVGGGTPTVLSAEQLDELLTFAFGVYGGFGRECTVEAGRPDTIDREKLTVLRRLGVRRISINPQTMHDETLSRIGRAHTVRQTVEAYELAREVGFDTVNMDVIAGLPGETPKHMEETCAQIERLKPENLTVHALAIKRSSQLKKQLGDYPLPSAAQAVQMTDAGKALAQRLGMRPYYLYRQKYMRGNLENVGYALSGHDCIYNIDMMEETASILSHGAGAMTKRVFDGENRIERLPAPKDVPTYINKLDTLIAEKRRFFL